MCTYHILLFEKAALPLCACTFSAGSLSIDIYLTIGPIGQNFCCFCDLSVREKAWRSRKHVAFAKG